MTRPGFFRFGGFAMTKTLHRRGMIACLAACISLTASVRGEEKAAGMGDQVADVAGLRDLHGNGRLLHGFKDHKAIVVVFLGSDCPISNLYVPRLKELEKKYRDRGVQFLAVYPNHDEDLDQVAMHSYDRDIPFPVLKDCSQRLAEAVGATRVPSAAVLDGEFKLRYRGRIDDRYGASARREKASRADLAEAIDEVLAGKNVSMAEIEADGCLIDHGGRKYTKDGVTYARDVARILQNRCQACHRPGQTAPFSLLTYDDAVKHARMLKEVTTQRRMPPWHADPRYGHFANDRRMSKDEIETLAAWVDAGTPRGNIKDEPKAIDWAGGWRHGKPDLILKMPEEFEVPADGVLNYQRWTLDPGFTEDKWVTIAEGQPGAPSVVHHLVVYILKPGQKEPWSADGTIAILVGWAPGDLGTVCPPDTALRLPKGCKLQFEMHYTPNGTKTRDRSMIGVTFAKKPPRFEYITNSFANESIVVPPYDPNYRAEAIWRMLGDARILSFVPHMHWRGKSFYYEVIYPDGRKEPLLSVPRWDFNWQNVYQLKEPLRLPKGAKLHAVAHWDNSTNNPYNPAPEKKAAFGLQTWDEMMVGWVAFVWERPETAAEVAKIRPDDPDLLFDRFDRNGDDVITPDEIPDQFKGFMKLNNIEVPEKITREQFKQMFDEMRKRFARPRPNPDKKPDAAKKPDR
jgi:hypothetical protein